MKKSKWNELEIALLVLLAVCLLTGAMSLRNQDVLQQKMIRLHVVANSDSDRDQTLKLQVRDKVLDYTTGILQRAKDMEDAQTQLRELLGANDADIKPLLGDYEVRALADDERQHLVHVQVVKYLRHFPNVLGHDERSDLAADLERAVCSHALMLAQVELGYVFYYAAEGLF